MLDLNHICHGHFIIEIKIYEYRGFKQNYTVPCTVSLAEGRNHAAPVKRIYSLSGGVPADEERKGRCVLFCL